MAKIYTTHLVALVVMFLLAFSFAVVPVYADHSAEEEEASHSMTHDDDHNDHGDHSHDSESSLSYLQTLIDQARAQIEMLVAQITGETHDMTHDDMMHDHGTHVHTLLEVDEDIPTIDIMVHEDPMNGYNVKIETTNFTFTPENASTDHIANEGHAHIYVDESKVGRVYGNWYHLPYLGESGEHTIRVELSANDHSVYAHDGEKIDDTVTVTVE